MDGVNATPTTATATATTSTIGTQASNALSNAAASGKPAITAQPATSAQTKAAVEKAVDPGSVLSESELDKVVKVTIGGKLQEKTIREIREDYQLKNVSHQKMDQAHRAEMQHRQLVEMAQHDPIRYLTEVAGINHVDLAEQILSQKVKEMQMSPEQRELEQLRREKAMGAEQQKQWQAQQEQAKQLEMQSQFEDQYFKEFADAIHKAGIDPKTEKGRYAMMKIAHNANILTKQEIDFSIEELASNINNEYGQELISVLSSLSDEEGLAILEKAGLMKRYRNADVKRLKANTNSSLSSQGALMKTGSVKKSRGMTEKEYREWFDKKREA